MKKTTLFAILFCPFFACQQTQTADPSWVAFQKCASLNCVKEALAVKDAFLKNPKMLLTDFQNTYEKGQDHLIGWLYLMRDSVLTNPQKGTLSARIEMQKSIINAAKPFENDAKLKEISKTVVEGMEHIAMMAETEGEGETFEPSTEPITGIYEYNNGDWGNGNLEIGQIAANKFKFSLNIIGGPPSHTGGQMSGEVTFSAKNEGFFTLKEFGDCQLVFTINNGSATIKTLKGDPATCGFGMNVMPDGVFARKSFANPFLSKKDAKMEANLFGDWQSKDDSKSGIEIKNGVFLEKYEGQKPNPPMRYVYYSVCPKDCNPSVKMPCLKVIGQDEVCYTIVKADGKILELSLIGGRGNTLHYALKK